MFEPPTSHSHCHGRLGEGRVDKADYGIPCRTLGPKLRKLPGSSMKRREEDNANHEQ